MFLGPLSLFQLAWGSDALDGQLTTRALGLTAPSDPRPERTLSQMGVLGVGLAMLLHNCITASKGEFQLCCCCWCYWRYVVVLPQRALHVTLRSSVLQFLQSLAAALSSRVRVHS